VTDQGELPGGLEADVRSAGIELIGPLEVRNHGSQVTRS
jgi:hypothetical protein